MLLVRFQVFEVDHYQCPHKCEQFWVRNLLSAGKSIYLIYNVILDFKLKQLISFLFTFTKAYADTFRVKISFD